MPLNRIKDALGRSIALEQRFSQTHIVLVDPQKAPPLEQQTPLSQLRAELRTLLLVHQLDPDAQPMRHLEFVHEALGKKGWAGLESLTRRVTARALVEAELMDGLEPSPLLATLIERLRARKLAADQREERDSQLRELEASAMPEVSETNFDEFELMERSWAGTIPSALKQQPPLET